MALKDSLTTEKLSSRFSNPFALVNYAISLAKAKVERGEEARGQNLASEILEMILNKEETPQEEARS